MIDLKVSLIQTDLMWEDVDSNIALLDEKIDRIGENTDLIVLPEMFTTGFSLNAGNFGQEMKGPTVKWLQTKSREKNADITGSIIIKEGGFFFNRLVWAKPKGELLTYDKGHLFRMTGEDKVYTPGRKKITVELNGWKIRPFICYDLRFPIWTRNLDNEYDVAVFIANWPEKRSSHWKSLLQARAIENLSYVIGVNRVGRDGKGYSYSGDSSVIDPIGNVLFQKSHNECIHTASLSHLLVKEHRESFPAWMDADKDMYFPP